MNRSLYLLVVLPLAVATISLTSCKKKIHKVNEDYIGYWEGDDDSKLYTFDIADDSQATYEEIGAFSNVSITNKLRIRDEKMRLGVIKRFTVDQHPTSTDSGNVWTMVLDGVTYYSEK